MWSPVFIRQAVCYPEFWNPEIIRLVALKNLMFVLFVIISRFIHSTISCSFRMPFWPVYHAQGLC